MKKISIIIPVYNISAYLRRCLDSVINQTYHELEIILVDDGSTDESGAICDEYAAKDDRVKVIHKENGGLSDARNAGLLVATGDFIGYVDGDDYIELEMYELMINALTEHHGGIAVCRYRQVGEGAMKTVFPEPTGAAHVFSRTEALDIYIREDEQYQFLSSVWSKLFTREVVSGIDFDTVKYPEDIMYTTKALCRCNRVVYLDKELYNYIVDRTDSLMNQKTGEKRLDSEVPVWKEQIRYLHSQGYPELSDKAAYFFYRQMLFYFMNFKMGKKRELARRLSQLLRSERQEIRRIYLGPWSKSGDKARMRTFLFWPHLYYLLVMAYERYVIPVRTRRINA
jgi:glycosyltransferase involved in cell wall biosynthesis